METCRKRALSGRVELPGDVLGEIPHVTLVGRTNERVGIVVTPAVDEVDLASLHMGGREVGTRRDADHERERLRLGLIGRSIEELRRTTSIDDKEPRALERKAPWREVGWADIGWQ